MGDAEFGDALVFSDREWFYRTIHRKSKSYLYAAVFVVIIYIILLWGTDAWWPIFPLSMLVLSLWVGGLYARDVVILMRAPSKPGLYERGLVSVLHERVPYSDVYRIELRRDNVHVLHQKGDNDDEVDQSAYFTRAFITDEGIERIRIQANLYR